MDDASRTSGPDEDCKQAAVNVRDVCPQIAVNAAYLDAGMVDPLGARG